MSNESILLRAYEMMCRAKAMAFTYESNRSTCRYVHSTSRGHEAIQLATAFNLAAHDFVSPYYRDESLMLGLGFTPYELMLQLLAKAADPFTGGREYYNHPNYRGNGKPTIIHQSSATGMQAIPTTGIAQGIRYWENIDPSKITRGPAGEAPVVVCSMGDASFTEGEVSEALQFAVLKQLPIIYLVQDNEWGISVSSREARAMNAYEYAGGFNGLNRVQVNGADFEASYRTMADVVSRVRAEGKPWLVHATVPLLGHHTSGVRKEFYRTDADLAIHGQSDPLPLLYKKLIEAGITSEELDSIEQAAATIVSDDFRRAILQADPDPSTTGDHVFKPATIAEETGERQPAGGTRIMMVDAALFAIREMMELHPEIVLYGQDVGQLLGGVFRETATLASQFGQHRVFNTAIQEAYIVGSTVGLNAVGIRPIVEVQFGDYLYPGFNQLVTEISKSCYLSCGKFPVGMVLRVPVGAYGGGGPYHSGNVETTLLSIKGIKVVYPSNAADMKGLMKAAILDGNPVVMLEHKGLYWSKVPGTDDARRIEPAPDYILPLGKAITTMPAAESMMENGKSCVVVTYGMGVHWALNAAREFNGEMEVLDLRTLYPLDEELLYERVRLHGKCLVLTEEQQNNSFAEALAARISKACFRWLDAPVEVLGAMNLPAVPMNSILEAAMLPDAAKLTARVKELLES
ncbi:MAG: tungsten formylmethanofuran dehydrogenase [Chitinophagaceae bacterium]|nr:MAG: tungsten formylmethanofuran dehydrogenase [Chitinophagaceae bacterium]